MKFLFVLDSVEAPQAVNPQLGRRLAAQLAKMGHAVHLLELWDGEVPPPAPAEGVVLHTLAFGDERRMNQALENGARAGSPVPVRLLRLAKHPDAVAAAFRQLVLHRPRRTTAAQKEIERLCLAVDFDAVLAVCAPYRAAFALAQAEITAQKLLWQLDPYASNQEYHAPGGAAREAELLRSVTASFITAQALPDYQSGPLAAVRSKVHVLEFPSLLPSAPAPGNPLALDSSLSDVPSGIRCVFCGNLHPEIRSPEFALKLFCALNLPDLTVILAGGGWGPFSAMAAQAKTVLGRRLQLPGPVSPAQARALLESADLLLSIGNTADNQMPSKIFEYLGIGKPILHLFSSDADPVLPFLAAYPLARTLRQADGVPQDTSTSAELAAWLRGCHGAHVPFDEVAARFPAWTPEAVAQKFLRVVSGQKTI